MSVNRAELRKLIVDLSAIPEDMREELAHDIRDGAELILDEMHRRASWSTRIPAATTMRASGTGAELSTSAARAPHARPYEGLSGDPFRHPVYGNRDNWVSQAARPFFFAAVEAKAGEVDERVGRGIDRVAARHGFH